MIYLASPYSHPDSVVVHHRFAEVCRAAGWLLANRFWCYSPIVHCHEIAQRSRLPTDHEYWLEYNKHMLVRSDQFYILHIPGWRESKGISEEYKYWTGLGNHGVTFLHPHERTYVKTRIEGCAPGSVLSGLDQSLHAVDQAQRVTG